METPINFNEKKGFICDMDGVIYHGNRILPGVAEFIQWLHDEDKEYLFLTNNSGYTPRELNQKLARMGVAERYRNVLTSGQAAGSWCLREMPGKKVFLLGKSVWLGRMNLTFLNCGRKKGNDDGRWSE